MQRFSKSFVWVCLIVGAVSFPARSEPLLAIKQTCLCNVYIPGVGTRGKLLVDFEYPHVLPDDLTGFRVYGPNGYRFAFNQAPMDGSNWNGYLFDELLPGHPPFVRYMAFQKAALESGVYVMAGIDRLGSTIHRVQVLEDKSSEFIPRIDVIDYNRFRPVRGREGTSLTPTIRWDLAEGADYYYMIRVMNVPLSDCLQNPAACESVYSDDIWGNGTGLNKSYTQIPPGTLEPSTTYYWFVEVCDSDVVDDINNCAFLPNFWFTTGPGQP